MERKSSNDQLSFPLSTWRGVRCSTILEDIATETQRSEGLDIADYIIDELKAKTKIDEIQSRFSQKLQSMIEINPALLLLIDRLKLEEI